MDFCVKEVKTISTEKRSDNLYKASLILSVVAILMTIALFIRMETVVHDTKMMDSKFTLQIQQIKEALKPEGTTRYQAPEKNDFDIANGMTKGKIVRRSLKTRRNDSVDLKDASDGFKRYVTSIIAESVESYCLSPDKVCVAGPPGPKGIQGNRGKRGPKGTKGRKGTKGIMGRAGEPGKQGMKGDLGIPGVRGEKGIMGTAGEQGKQGIMGDLGIPGVRGEKGDAGAAGHPGHPGPKGEPGESISAPEVIVSPASLTVTQNQTATFYCSAGGNPKPTVSWSKINGTGLVNNGGQDNKLQISTTGYNDSGSYVCKAANVLGQVQKVVKLFVEVPPQFTETLDRVIRVTYHSVASISCRVFGFPAPTIVWSRGLVSLPQGRTTTNNGTLNISNFSPQDSGTYQCKASNKLGYVSALTTLIYVKPDFWTSSSIIAGNEFYQSRLNQFLTPAIGSHPKWMLCYRASTHGWAASTFHSRCDGKRNTVTIIKNGQYVFGGYTDIPWASIRYYSGYGYGGSYGHTTNAFIFSLHNKEGLNPFKSMVTVASNAIYKKYDYGPTFGSGHDIRIANGRANSFTNFGSSYSVPSGVQHRTTILAGTNRFAPDEVEVFYLG